MKEKRAMKKERSGCCLGKLFKWIVYGFALMVVLALFGSVNGDKDAAQPTATVKASTSTAAPTATPTEEKLEILLAYPDHAGYGKWYTFNLGVEKATDADRTKKLQCFVPAGDYVVTNESKYWACVYVYANETAISEEGWEEHTDGWASPILKAGESCDITVPEGWYVLLQEPNIFRLVQK